MIKKIDFFLLSEVLTASWLIITLLNYIIQFIPFLELRVPAVVRWSDILLH